MCALQFKYIQKASGLKHSLGIEISLLQHGHMITDHMLCVNNKAWKKEQPQIVSALKQRGLILSADKRCHIPGHDTKCLTYSHFDQSFKNVVAVSLTQITEVEGVSNWTEKAGLIKVLDELKQKNVKVAQLITHRYLQIKKHLREQGQRINHQFDVWHFSKSIQTKLLKVSKKKACEELRPWINLWRTITMYVIIFDVLLWPVNKVKCFWKKNG